MAPEDVLIATLRAVGNGVRIADNTAFAAIFNDAAKQYPRLFGAFAWNPTYHHSKLLSDILLQLDLGGALRRENASTKYFEVTKRTAGAYGESKLRALSPPEQDAVKEVAGRILEHFAGTGGAVKKN